MQHILVIDDILRVAQGLRRDFAAAEYVVDVAESGEIGLAAFHKHPPDLVVLDRVRADMEGGQLLQRPPPPQRLAYADLVIDAASHTACRGQHQIVLWRSPDRA
jgi:CheY-like chemotaxis protein